MGSIMSDIYLGIEIGGTKIQIFAGRSSRELAQVERFAVEPGTDGPKLFKRIIEVCENYLRGHPCRGIGVGFGGPVRDGRVRRSFQIAGWENFPLGDEMEALLGVPVFVDNDANVAAYAEYLHAREIPGGRLFYLTIGSGIGGGFIIDGGIYRGSHGLGSEIGHLELGQDGRTLEACCSGWALDRQIKWLTECDPKSTLKRYIKRGDKPDARILKAALEAGDCEAQRILGNWAFRMGYILAHMIYLLHPGVVILGGGVSLLGSLLIERIQSELNSRLNEDLVDVPELRVAALGETVVPCGAILYAKQKMER